MKILILSIILFSLSVIYYSCGDNSVTPKNEEPTSNNYVKVVTAENGNLKFEIWSATASFLRIGYNKIGFKVFENNQEKNSGFVKFFPKMYHWLNSPMHSSPVKERYNYVDTVGMFTGYAIFTMQSDTSSFWYGFYNFNDLLFLDSALFNVQIYQGLQIKIFVDNQTAADYLITLIKPYSPAQGFNTFQCMLHRTSDDIHYEQVDDAQMYIMPWMPTMLHGSSNNVDPVHIGEGIYEGTANFNMPGEWYVYDTVYYQNRKITPNIPPKFTFNP
ncbi:MAG TPA: FixH family protein [Ignavibacteria bacterium]